MRCRVCDPPVCVGCGVLDPLVCWKDEGICVGYGKLGPPICWKDEGIWICGKRKPDGLTKDGTPYGLIKDELPDGNDIF